MNRVFQVLVLVVSAVLIGGGALSAEREELPSGLRGFSGQVRGVVVGIGDGNTFRFRVARVLRVWDGNKAATPQSLGGRTVWVGPRWVEGDGGRWHAVEHHVAFIRRIRSGQEMTLEIANVEGPHFNILELSALQRQSEGIRERGDRDGREGQSREGRGSEDGRREGGDRDHPEARREGGDRERAERGREDGERDHPEARRGGDGDREHAERRRGEGDRDRDVDARTEALEREVRVLREELEALRRRLGESRDRE